MDKYTATEQAYKHGYEKGYAAGKRDAWKWIPVTDRLPEDDVLVLCIGAKGGMFLGYPRRVWDGESTAYTIVPNARGARYTKYWMPLPEPPKEG